MLNFFFNKMSFHEILFIFQFMINSDFSAIAMLTRFFLYIHYILHFYIYITEYSNMEILQQGTLIKNDLIT